jgi:CheY-like chemotaxis protein
VWIEVRDTGVGIAPEQIGRIFEEFYQVGNPGRDRSQGLGIGLSIVQRLSRLLDHPLQVHSRPGRGTHFRVVLPTAAPLAGAGLQGAEAHRQHAAGAQTLPGRVLLVDDEAEIREAMSELLRSWSIEVQAVADEAEAEQALARAEVQAQPFDLLMCDYRLAGGNDGLDAGLRLRQRFGTGMPLLLITGETAPERLQRVRASGVAVLFKPVDAGKLFRTLSELAPAGAS